MHGETLPVGRCRQGEYIELMPLDDAAIPLVVLWLTDPQVTKLYAPKAQPPTENEVRRDFEKAAIAYDERHWLIQVNERYVGMVALEHINHGRATYKLMIGDVGYWHRGIATAVTERVVEYAFEQLKLSAIAAIILEENEPSLQVFRKVGFELLEILVQHGNAYYAQITKINWLNSRRPPE